MTVDVVPLVAMTPQHAAAAEVLGHRFAPDEMVTLAGAWLGARWYSPSLCELAASGWDEAGVVALWDAAFTELGLVAPSPDEATRLLAAPTVPAPRHRPVRRARRRTVPRHVPVRRR